MEFFSLEQLMDPGSVPGAVALAVVMAMAAIVISNILTRILTRLSLGYWPFGSQGGRDGGPLHRSNQKPGDLHRVRSDLRKPGTGVERADGSHYGRGRDNRPGSRVRG